MGVQENNMAGPDLAGYEIKSHRELSQSYITLFTKSPSSPKGANSYLRDSFGTPCSDNPKLKELHTSVFANKSSKYKNKYSFKLINDNKLKRIIIEIRSPRTNEILDNSCYYTYQDIEDVLHSKLKKLFLVYAKTKNDIKEKDKEYFYFYKAEIFERTSISNFLKLLDNGLIMYDIRIGSYKSGANMGKTHDHGSGFRIKGDYLSKLYTSLYNI